MLSSLTWTRNKVSSIILLHWGLDPFCEQAIRSICENSSSAVESQSWMQNHEIRRANYYYFSNTVKRRMQEESQKSFLNRRITCSWADTGIIVISGMHKTCLLILAEISSKYSAFYPSGNRRKLLSQLQLNLIFHISGSCRNSSGFWHRKISSYM